MSGALKLTLKAAISGLLVAYALSQADFRTAFAMLPQLMWLPLCLMLAANLASRLLAAYRWYRLVRPIRSAVRYSTFVRITLGSNFYGQFLPGGGVEALQVTALGRSESSISLALASVYVDRVFGLFALALLLLWGALLSGITLIPYVTMTGAAALAVSSLAAASFASPRLRRRLVRWVSRFAGAGLHEKILGIAAYFDKASGRLALMAESIGLAILMQILRVLMFFFGALALGTQLPIPVLMLSVPAILLFLALPISVGGIGIREGSLVFFFSKFGESSDLALALAMLIYLSNIVVAIPGAWYGLTMAFSSKQSARADRHQT